MAKPLDSAAQGDRLDLTSTVSGIPAPAGRAQPPRRPASSSAPGAPSTPAATTSTSTTAPTTPPSTTTTEPSDPTTTTEPPASQPPADGAPADRVVALVNDERAERGCPAVRVDARLTRAASDHSSDMSKRGYFSHTSPEGVTFDQRIRATGHPGPGAENIARGQSSAESVMEAWMTSTGHRANILNCQLTAIGIGLDTNGWFWTQDFGY
jgi:uncharacterized protein YkwD